MKPNGDEMNDNFAFKNTQKIFVIERFQHNIL